MIKMVFYGVCLRIIRTSFLFSVLLFLALVLKYFWHPILCRYSPLNDYLVVTIVFSCYFYAQLVSRRPWRNIFWEKCITLFDANFVESYGEMVLIKSLFSFFRILILEEQLRENELRSEEKYAEEVKRHRELVARVDREKQLQVENCAIR